MSRPAAGEGGARDRGRGRDRHGHGGALRGRGRAAGPHRRRRRARRAARGTARRGSAGTRPGRDQRGRLERDRRRVLEQHGRIDVLVNNAGVFLAEPLATTSLAQFNKVLDVNVVGVFLGMRAVAAHMSARGSGSIINVSSLAGLTGGPLLSAYAASKWAVRGMTKVAARELARAGVRVNSVHPGQIDTDMNTRQREATPELIDRLVRTIPLGPHRHARGGRPRARVPRLRRERLHHRLRAGGGRRQQRLSGPRALVLDPEQLSVAAPAGRDAGPRAARRPAAACVGPGGVRVRGRRADLLIVKWMLQYSPTRPHRASLRRGRLPRALGRQQARDDRPAARRAGVGERAGAAAGDIAARRSSSTCTCSKRAAWCARTRSAACAPARSSRARSARPSAGSASGGRMGGAPRPPRRVSRRTGR